MHPGWGPERGVLRSELRHRTRERDPEPGSLVLLATALALVGFLHFRKMGVRG